jgi:hypothetical protein
MGRQTRAQQGAELWVADLPEPSTDAREPWPVLSVSPEARSLFALGHAQWTALDALPTGTDAATPRTPRRLPAGLVPTPMPPASAPTMPQRAPVPARPMAATRAMGVPPAHPPRVLRQATPPMYAAPAQARGPIRGRVPEAAKKSLGIWSFLALVMGLASLAPFVWQDAPLQWIPVTGITAIFCAVMVFSQAQRGVTPHGTISAARWGCAFAVIATTLWIVGILLLTGQLSVG